MGKIVPQKIEPAVLLVTNEFPIFASNHRMPHLNGGHAKNRSRS